jgi:hypothetical protein
MISIAKVSRLIIVTVQTGLTLAKDNNEVLIGPNGPE